MRPRKKFSKIAIFVADVLEALEKKKNPWVRMMERLGGFYDKRFAVPTGVKKNSST